MATSNTFGTPNNTVGTLNGFFKETYAEKLGELIPDGVKLLNKIKFMSKDKQPGNLYHQPVILGLEHGVTFAGSDEDAFNLNAYYGLSYAYPLQAFIFLLSALGVMGFPITSTFIGEDVIFSHVHETQYFLAFAVALGFVLSGIALIRVYARLFLGPHYKTDHPSSLRAS